MQSKYKAIIFDWGRTLFDSETKEEFSEAQDVLLVCNEMGIKLAVVSLVTHHANATLEERRAQIENSPLRKYFEYTRVTDADKDAILDEVVLSFALPRENILIVDDRTVRGIRYGNMHGHPTVWLQKGKFTDELPNEETGQPIFTIHDLQELTEIIQEA